MSDRTVYAVGDVHGQAAALRALLVQILEDAGRTGERGRPRVVLLGDLVDRGPDSRGVLDMLARRDFREVFDATIIRGNHDQWVLEAAIQPDAPGALEWLHNGGAETIESYGVDFGRSSWQAAVRAFLGVFPRAHLELLRNTEFSVREPGLFFCHGGVDPARPLEAQQPMAMMWPEKSFLADRTVSGVRVVHGHWVTDTGRVEIHANRIAVDTGAGFAGGSLSAAVIEPGGQVRVMSVPAGPQPATPAFAR